MGLSGDQEEGGQAGADLYGHDLRSAAFDGKDYPISGNPAYDAVSLKRLGKWGYQGTRKKAGKPVQTYTVTISDRTLSMARITRSAETRRTMRYRSSGSVNGVIRGPGRRRASRCRPIRSRSQIGRFRWQGLPDQRKPGVRCGIAQAAR